MASITTHLVIGERVFTRLPQLDPADLGSFLLGCLLVDVHWFSDIDRFTTHFAERFDGEGPYAFNRSCVNFMRRLDRLLIRPWDELTSAEQAFIAGYFCHLAADEDWKRFDWHMLHTLGIRWWADLPVPGDVIVSAFDVLSSELYIDFPTVKAALSDISIPNVLTHVPHATFQMTWEIAQIHIMSGSTLYSALKMFKRMGKTSAEMQTVRHQHEVYWEHAVAFIQDDFGGVQPRIQAMVQRSLERMPLLYQQTREPLPSARRERCH